MAKFGDYSDGSPLAGTDILLVKRPSGPSTLRGTLANLLTYVSANLDSDLVALAGLSSTGLIARTGSGTVAARTLTAPAAGLTISNSDGVSGNPTVALANDLAALEALSGTNTLYYRSAADTWSAVTIGSNLTFSGGTLSAASVSVGGGLLAANNLSDLASTSTARTNLGLGTAATQNTGTSGANVPLLNGANTHSGLATFSAGADLTPAATPSTTAVGYLGAPQNIVSANYTTVMSDAGKHLYHTSGSAHTVTIDSNANVAYPIGTVIAIVNENAAAALTIAITSDTLRWGSSTGSRTLAANGTASLIKVASTTWRLTGDGIT